MKGRKEKNERLTNFGNNIFGFGFICGIFDSFIYPIKQEV